jgi:hypothetical protein
MKNSIRLMRSKIDWDSGTDEVVSDLNELDTQMSHGRVAMNFSQCFN